MRSLCAKIAEQHAIPIEFEASDHLPHLPVEVEIGLFRILQESRTHAPKHSQTARITGCLTTHEDGIELHVAEASDEAQALTHANALRPDVIVLDLDHGGRNGLEALRLLEEKGLQFPVVIQSIHRRQSYFNEAIDRGVSAFVLKENSVTEMLDAVASAAQGRTWFSPSLSDFWSKRERDRSQIVRDNPGLTELTLTERKIVRAIADNRTSREIAEAMGLSPLTVETHRRNICRKLGLTGSHPLLDYALRHRDRL